MIIVSKIFAPQKTSRIVYGMLINAWRYLIRFTITLTYMFVISWTRKIAEETILKLIRKILYRWKENGDGEGVEAEVVGACDEGSFL